MWPQVLLPLPPVDHTPLTTTINSLHSELMHYWHLMAPLLDEQAWCAATWCATWHIWLIIAHCLMIITPADPKPYHTSILSGEMWVQELLDGHPDRILCELGVQKEIFEALICTLRAIGTTDSKHVSLEEQLAIFLYMYMTGLTICHTGEQFQCSNNTISKCFCKMLFIFSSGPFYTTYVNLPNANTPPHEKYVAATRCGHFSNMHSGP